MRDLTTSPRKCVCVCVSPFLSSQLDRSSFIQRMVNPMTKYLEKFQGSYSNSMTSRRRNFSFGSHLKKLAILFSSTWVVLSHVCLTIFQTLCMIIPRAGWLCSVLPKIITLRRGGTYSAWLRTSRTSPWSTGRFNFSQDKPRDVYGPEYHSEGRKEKQLLNRQQKYDKKQGYGHSYAYKHAHI